jgi:hypothetical protein
MGKGEKYGELWQRSWNHENIVFKQEYGRYEAINISAKTEKQNAGIIVISPVENILTI